MLRRLGCIVSLLVTSLLAGCGLQPGPQREPWRGQAEAACLARGQVRATAYTEPMKPISGPGVCGMDNPFRVMAFEKGSVMLRSRGVLACPMISMFDRWLDDVVQPAAATYYGTRVAEVQIGTYNCRRMNNARSGHISEHAYGNAIDLMGLKLADGRTVSVERGWRGDIADQEFLRSIFVGACEYFTTVLAPGSNIYHYNHIHMDLAQHAKGRRYCKPVLKWAPQTPAPMQPGPSADARLEADPHARQPMPAAGNSAAPAQPAAEDGAPAEGEPPGDGTDGQDGTEPDGLPQTRPVATPADRISSERWQASTARPSNQPTSINDLLR